MLKSNFFKNISLLALLSICFIAFSYPIFISGLWADDALNTYSGPLVDWHNQSIFALSKKVYLHWLNVEGRSMLMFYTGYFFFSIFQNIYALKSFNILLVFLNLIMFYVFLSYYAKNKILPFLPIFIVLLTYQVNPYANDPLCAYSFHYPILFIQLFILLITLLKYIENKKIIYLVALNMLWFFFLLFYEINIIFYPLALIIINSKCNELKIRNMFFLSITFVIIISYFYFIKINSNGGQYLSLNLKIFTLIEIFIKQALSTIPLISYFSITENLSYNFYDLLKDLFKPQYIMLSFVSYIFLRIYFKNLNSFKFPKGLILIGFSLIFFPAAIISITEKYQSWINLGSPAITIYYQYFGLSILFTYSLLWIKNKYLKISKLIIIFLPIIFSMNVLININTVERNNITWKEPREKFEEQVRDGMLSEIKNGDIISFLNTPNYINEYFIYKLTNKKIINLISGHSWFNDEQTENDDIYILEYKNNKYQLIKI